ncbi:PocR ligand-binding domain-containing protein [Cetobacterium sp. SF1]|uniref:PocR ligand-binding domain-containing protein n=1 Tax=Cetobacterium sp. SF1 TaxID=3417654 RepID=UPI003CF9C9D6
MLYKFKKEIEKIQNQIALFTGLGIVVVDLKGNYITSKENYSKFCSEVRNKEFLGKSCRECDMKGLKKSFLLKKPYIYQCHFGLIDIAIPLILNGEAIGAFLVGQIFLESKDKNNIEKILDKNLEEYFSYKYLRNTMGEIPVYTYEKLENLSIILNYFAKYILGEIKNNSLESKGELKSSNLENIDYMNKIVQPSLDFIDDNLEKKISLEEMAKICNLSISHFSKVFKRETGKTLHEYINRKKIQRAKYMLSLSNLSIYEIGLEIGFEDSSYFTKVFKKYVGLSPKEYRGKI